jgi:hypothetical protein
MGGPLGARSPFFCDAARFNGVAPGAKLAHLP